LLSTVRVKRSIGRKERSEEEEVDHTRTTQQTRTTRIAPKGLARKIANVGVSKKTRQKRNAKSHKAPPLLH